MRINLFVNILFGTACIIIFGLVILISYKLYRYIPKRNNSNKVYKEDYPSIMARAISCLIYFLPLLEGIAQFGIVCIDDHSWIRIIYKNTLAYIVVPYLESPLIGFCIFITLYLIFVRGIIQISKFIKFHIVQALLLYLLDSVIGTVLTSLPLEIGYSFIGDRLADTLLLITFMISIYAGTDALKGQYSNIPLISEAAKMQSKSTD
uniref:Tic20 family protein Ycf60 n=1 Tax=Cyanidium caldarium TaxID=2771 RepID=YCF60_CYACA|nr:hypothetical protein JXY51_pgp133 [Cyanidium caldarium]O19916.1 RecName: Full=Tic20 family protein Ycf60 [Cyanidium caldarium]AAB82673.1 unknown [Cyanidium caldarium]WDB00215.1 hypothetical protein CDCA019_093 [Cyanidium caldarium]